MTDEITVNESGNATVCGNTAHILWNYCRGEFPRTKCCANNFYVMADVEMPQGHRWDIIAGQTTRAGAERYMKPGYVLIDVTNAPKS